MSELASRSGKHSAPKFMGSLGVIDPVAGGGPTPRP